MITVNIPQELSLVKRWLAGAPGRGGLVNSAPVALSRGFYALLILLATLTITSQTW